MSVTRRAAAIPVLLILLLAACGPGSSEDPVVVDVWFHAGQGGERETLEDQIQHFNISNADVQVALRLLPEGDYAALVADAGPDLPCLLDLDGPFLTAYAGEGLLQPLDDLIAPEVTDTMLASIIEQGTYDGRLYGLGTFDSGLGLWANRVYLEAADVRIPEGVEDAWTFEEFNAALRSLQALPEVEHAIEFKLNYGVGEWFTYGMSPMVWGFGGDIYDPEASDPAAVLASPETVAAMEWWQGLFDDGLAPSEQVDDDAFYAQRTVALSWVGHWMWEQHRQGLGDDLVLLPLPQFPAAQVTGLGSWQWGITTTCESPEAAATFLSFLLQPTEVVAITDANGAVPASDDAIALSTLYGPEGPLRVFADQLESGLGRARPVTPDYQQVTSTFADAVNRIRLGDEVEPVLRAAASTLADASR